jgi:hypothetical protein
MLTNPYQNTHTETASLIDEITSVEPISPHIIPAAWTAYLRVHMTDILIQINLGSSHTSALKTVLRSTIREELKNAKREAENLLVCSA